MAGPRIRVALRVIGAVIAVGLVVAIAALARYEFTPSIYEVTLVNRAATELTGGELHVNEVQRGIRALAPGAVQTLRIPVRSDGHYVVTARWSDGTTMIDSTGYVTHGLEFSDTLHIRGTGLTMGRSSVAPSR